MSKRKSCFCEKTYSGSFMLCCDGCDIWSDGECVGVRKGQIPESLKWFCYSCSQKVHEETIRRLGVLEKKTNQLREDYINVCQANTEKEKRHEKLVEILQNKECKLSMALKDFAALKGNFSRLQQEFAKVSQPRTEMKEENNNVLKDKDSLEIADKTVLSKDNNLSDFNSQLKELEEENARVCEAYTNSKKENEKLTETIQTAEEKILSAINDNRVLTSNLSKLQEEYAKACQLKIDMEKDCNMEAGERKVRIVDNETVLKSEFKQLEEQYMKVREENETLKIQLKRRNRLSLNKSAIIDDQGAV